MFWQYGYRATTYSILEKETGIAGKSLINTFGDKDKLFLRVVKMYQYKAEDRIIQLLTPPSRAGITKLFESLDQSESISDYGCLMANAISELNQLSPNVKRAVTEFGLLWEDIFKRGLESDNIPDAEIKAKFLLGMFWGILSHVKLMGSVKAVTPMVKVTVQTIKGW